MLLLSPHSSYCQFPAICNTKANLDNKICCPNDCSKSDGRGICKSITAEVKVQWESANSTLTDIIRDAAEVPEKSTTDSRYLWPTAVFENVCECHNNYGGVDCSECDFGWTGEDCEEKSIIIRKPFRKLKEAEKINLIEATIALKNETDQWSVIIAEPREPSGTVKLLDISTYDFLVHIHSYVSRDKKCVEINNNTRVDFAHSGPVFPVWHRHYLLIIEKEYQRVMNDTSFGLPYWQWEENDRTPFTDEYFGQPSNSYGVRQNITGVFGNPQKWNTVCDLLVYDNDTDCSDNWKLCNPDKDLENERVLQRGDETNQGSYLPNSDEVKIAIAAPSFHAADENGSYIYLQKDPRTSFRSRLEGWNTICSAATCTGPRDPDEKQYMHNNVHNWIGGHMGVISAAVNDPIFNLHHCNVDRILESWMQRFTNETLPTYDSVTGGHPGHNWDDYMVPFFPLIKVSERYKTATELGYKYDNLISADKEFEDDVIADCGENIQSCPICDANGTCINCTSQTCSQPRFSTENIIIIVVVPIGIGIIFTAIISSVIGCYKVKKKVDPARQRLVKKK